MAGGQGCLPAGPKHGAGEATPWARVPAAADLSRPRRFADRGRGREATDGCGPGRCLSSRSRRWTARRSPRWEARTMRVWSFQTANRWCFQSRACPSDPGGRAARSAGSPRVQARSVQYPPSPVAGPALGQPVQVAWGAAWRAHAGWVSMTTVQAGVRPRPARVAVPARADEPGLACARRRSSPGRWSWSPGFLRLLVVACSGPPGVSPLTRGRAPGRV